jgi:hypothetical protein
VNATARFPRIRLPRCSPISGDWRRRAEVSSVRKRTRAVSNDNSSTMKTFFSIVLAVAVSISSAWAGRGGHGGHGGQHGKHGKHFSSVSQRGGHAFSRGGSKFSRARSGTWGGHKWSGGYWAGRKWNGGYWGGRNWNGGYWNGGRFIFIGGLGYPYNWGWYPYWGWRYPYSYSYYSYYPYSYYPSYGYDYGYYNCSVSRRRFFGP